MNLFENLQLLKEEVYIWLNRNNHTINWNYNLPDNIRNYSRVSNDTIEQYANINDYTLELDGLDDPTEFINDVFNNQDVRNNILDRYARYIDKNTIKKPNFPKCSICNTRLTDGGDCPKCLTFPDYEDSEENI